MGSGTVYSDALVRLASIPASDMEASMSTDAPKALANIFEGMWQNAESENVALHARIATLESALERIRDNPAGAEIVAQYALSQQQEGQYEQRTDDAMERAKEGARALRAKATELLREAESLDRWANPQEE